MKTLVAATMFAAVALAAQSAVACDWNRQASTEQQAATAAAQPQPAGSTATQAPSVAADASKPVAPAAGVVLVTDRH
ncbi:MAG TPA: hypothetical protein VKR55_01530 [Bradyrhizobium sp.]|uniref:hypothetical protein n=1 Tax=Bradyrhizobium sp. TaxID=376 RepID=UPI002C4D8D25|nr:hypothetical protein [Bradyrhizobium sp.]HLZ00812.1 hypothetical protein [Bradyrhizobium sp.]